MAITRNQAPHNDRVSSGGHGSHALGMVLSFLVVCLLAAAAARGSETREWFDPGSDEGQYDYYHFTIEATADIVAKTTDAEGECSLRSVLTLVDSSDSGDIAQVEGAAESCSTLRTRLAPGEYQVRVEGSAGGALPSYYFSLEIEPVQDTDDSYRSSVVLANDTVRILDVFPMLGFAEGTHDTFRFATDEEEILTAWTSAGTSGCSGDTRIELYQVSWDGEREHLAGDDDGGEIPCSRLELPIGVGDYELEVHAAEGEAMPAYTVTLDRQVALSEQSHPMAGPDPDEIARAQDRIDASITAAADARYQEMLAEAQAAMEVDLAERVRPGFDRLPELRDAVRELEVSMSGVATTEESRQMQTAWFDAHGELLSDAFRGASTTVSRILRIPPKEVEPESVCCLKDDEPAWASPSACEDRLPPEACMPAQVCCCLPDDGPGSLGAWSTRSSCRQPFCLNGLASNHAPDGCVVPQVPPRGARRVIPSPQSGLAVKHQALPAQYSDIDQMAPFDPRVGRQGVSVFGAAGSFGGPSQSSVSGRVAVRGEACGPAGREAQWAEVGMVLRAQPAARYMQITAVIDVSSWSCVAWVPLLGFTRAEAGLAVHVESLQNIGPTITQNADACIASYMFSDNSATPKRFVVQTTRFQVIPSLEYSIRAGARSMNLGVLLGCATTNLTGRVVRITVSQWS